jgi:hypothetical protein
MTPMRELVESRACKFFRTRKIGEAKGKGVKYHETQVSPLVQKIPVHVDTVRLAQIFRDQGSDRGEILFFEGVLVLYVA